MMLNVQKSDSLIGDMRSGPQNRIEWYTFFRRAHIIGATSDRASIFWPGTYTWAPQSDVMACIINVLCFLKKDKRQMEILNNDSTLTPEA